MRLIELNNKNVNNALRLFQESLDRNEMLYKPCTKEKFVEIFLHTKAKGQVNINIIDENGRAFAGGSYIIGAERAFITMIVVDERVRRQGLGREILGALEDKLRKEKNIKKLEIVFFNPVALEWLIPGEEGCDHPNAPGVDMSSGAYLFFKNCGYRDFAVQNSYFINLQEYHMPKWVETKRAGLRNQNITFTLYDGDNHCGMGEMIRKFYNPLWERDILGEIQKDDGGRPILITEHMGKVCAFAGPLDVQESGRGYFAGIGVDEDYRGKGIAKVLFNCLCEHLKNIGAGYMTLFTGENNPARNIYERAGFKIVRSWADMCKEIRDSSND